MLTAKTQLFEPRYVLLSPIFNQAVIRKTKKCFRLCCRIRWILFIHIDVMFVKQKSFFLFLYGLVCLGCLFLNSELFNDTGIVPKQYFGAACLCLLIGWMSLRLRQFLWDGNAPSRQKAVCTTALLCVCAQTIYAFYCHYKGHGQMFQGSFDNPAGLAASLICVFPFVLVVDGGKGQKLFHLLAGICLMAALVMSRSRAGVLAAALPLVVVIMQQLRIGRGKKVALLFACFLLLAVGSYFLKRDSADGRLLIWRCSWDLFCQRPLLGWGPHGFMAHYMEAQAQYLSIHPDSPAAMLADNVHQPFNEWLGIAVRYGLAGLTAIGIIVVLLFHCYRETTDNPSSHRAALSLSSIAVFACFSYPFTYPLVWIIALTDAAILIENALRAKGISLSPAALCLTRWAMPVCCLLGLFVIAASVDGELAWKRTQNKALRGRSEEAMKEFAMLEKRVTLARNPYFLYNYAAEQNIAGNYAGSLETALQCRRLWADYDLQLLIAQDCEKLGKTKQAEEAYLLASDMCPCRFYPLYLLALLYESDGRHEQARQLAETIIEKPVKVPSATVNMIKAKMQEMKDSY